VGIEEFARAELGTIAVANDVDEPVPIVRRQHA